MKTSRSSRLAKRCALLFVPAIPFVLGANENGGCVAPPSVELTPVLPSLTPLWPIGCDDVQYTPNGTDISGRSKTCLIPSFASNVDPICSTEPTAFFVVDGLLYDANRENPIDLKPLLGGKIPNASGIPVVAIPDSNVAYLFFGHVPPETAIEPIESSFDESPQAFFIVLDREEFRTKAPENRHESIKAAFPLDIDPKENLGCGTIHLAATAADPMHPNSATVFVATCSNAYGFRVEMTDSEISRTRFFHEEVVGAGKEQKPKPNAHHRAEMEVATAKNGYGVFWPYEGMDGSTYISATLLETNGTIVAHGEKKLDFTTPGVEDDGSPSTFIKGIELANDWSALYVTWPGDPKELFVVPLLKGETWSEEKPYPYFAAIKESLSGEIFDIGSSQIQTGPDGALYVLDEDRIVTVIPGYPPVVRFNGKSAESFTASTTTDWTHEPIRLLPAMAHGGTNMCNWFWYGDDDNKSSSSNETESKFYRFSFSCSSYDALQGPAVDACGGLRNECAKTACDQLYWWAYFNTTVDKNGACKVEAYSRTEGISQSAIDTYHALEECVTCKACIEPFGTNGRNYCDTISNPESCF